MSFVLDHSQFVDLEAALASIDCSWESLCRESQEIVLFGSRSIGAETESSDWDILCVGRGRARKTRRIDLLWMTPDELDQDEWLTSEIASHITCYGRWLVGRPSRWTAHVVIADRTLDDKRRWLRLRLKAWERSWHLVSQRLQRRYLRSLRRNLQRHAYLAAHCPVPPSPILDERWRALDAPREELERLARATGIEMGFVTRVVALAASDLAEYGLDDLGAEVAGAAEHGADGSDELGARAPRRHPAFV